MLSGQNMLLTANIAVWTGIALYVLGLDRRFVRLERRLRQLEITRAENEQPQ
jgi:CcmD family protein